jgi:drug/metabolite transporter (DMT)-like permease
MSVSQPGAAASAAAKPQHPLVGVSLFLFGLLLFACMDSTTKYLAERYDVPLIVAVRYAVNLLLLVALAAPMRGRMLVETNRTALVLVRGSCLAGASILVGLALQRMPVAETTAITFLAPMIVVLVARPVLGERIGILGWIAVIGGFAGVLLVVRPGSGLEAAGIAFALCAVATNAGYQTLSRLLGASERTLAMLFYAVLIGTIAFGIAAPFFWGGPKPGPFELLLFASLGVYGGLGHYLFTYAFRRAPASVLAPLTYFQLVWAGLLGWLVFGHLPDPVSIAGMAVIAGSGLLIALKPREQAPA